MQTFKQFLNEAPLPPEWDKTVFTPQTSFQKQLRYAIERSKKIGTGSSRVAFEIQYEGRPTILKIAKNKKGLAQNSKEADYGLYQMYEGIVIPLIDYDEVHDQPLWVHFEKAEKLTVKKFHQLTGFQFDTFAKMLYNAEINRLDKGWNYSISPEETQKIEKSELFEQVISLMGDFDILASDLGRLVNWGVYQNRPVILDLGFRSDVQREFYS